MTQVRSSVSRIVNAPRAEVWAAVSDPSRMAEWVPTHDHWIGRTPPSLEAGAKVRAQVTMFSMVGTIEMTVADCRAPKTLQLTGVGIAGTHLTYTLTLSSEDAAESLVTLETCLDGAALRHADASIIEHATTMEAKRSLRRLADGFAVSSHP
ncbi:type II toxin-antitoxin system Rv0910 family toxin [Nocardia thraciensis]